MTVGHVVLVGAMGSGKTTIGAELADRLGRSFVDSDDQIESTYGATGRELADRRGVAWLHEAEASSLIVALETPYPTVVAAAASIADRTELVERLASNDVFVVLLDGDIDVLAARAEAGGHRRPFNGEGMADRIRHRTKRLAQVADVVVDVAACDPGEAADRVLAAWEQTG